MEGRVSFSLFGTVAAHRDGVALDLGTRKQRALLALLLLDAGTTVSVDTLTEKLWRGEPPARASASLQAYVSNLRRSLEPDRPTGAAPTVLRTEAPGYRLDVDPDQIDVSRFTRWAAQVRRLVAAGELGPAVVAADDALDCWVGRPLAEFADEPWAEADVARLDELRRAVVEDRLRAMVDGGEATAAVPELERQAEEHPYHESVWALLMLALYRTGRTADALDRYQRARTVLGEDLGLEPGPELRELEAAILRQDDALRPAPAPRPTAPPRVVRQVPSDDRPQDAPAGDPLVGRTDEVQVIEQIVASLSTPEPGWLVLEGEAGIGKTRLAEELAAEARGVGALVAWGRAHEDGDAPGFWPWLQVLSDLGEDASALRDAADGDRFARYERVADVLRSRAASQPVVVVIDDLHWADPDSLRLLAFLAVQVRREPVAVVATCRDSEPSPELLETLGTLTRRPGLRRRTVGPFGVDDVAELAARIARTPVDRAEIVVLHERTAGNPFLVGELLRLPPSERTEAVPSGVRDVLRRRLSTLPEESRTALGLAAVIGRRFDLPLLSAASDDDPDRLADLVDAALARRIVVPGDGPISFRFAHDLLRETLLDELGDLRRRRLHARVADALAAMPAGSDRRLTELAHHRVEAASIVGTAVAVETAEAAAARATDALAFDEAARWCTAALGVLDDDPDADPDGADRQRLLLRGARATALAGRVLPWRAQVGDALRTALDRDDLDAAVDAVSVLVGGGAAWLWSLSYEDPTEMLSLLDSLLGRLDPGDTARRCRVTAAVAQGVYYRDGADRSAELARVALGLARDDGEPGLVAAALVNLAQCLWGADGIEEQLRVTGEVLALPAGVATVEHRLACLAIRATALLTTGELDGADDDHEHFVALAEQHGRHGVLAQLAWYRATRATVVGELDDYEELVDDAHRLQQALEVYLTDLIHAGAVALGCYARDDLTAIPGPQLDVLMSFPFGAGGIYAGLIALQEGRADEARDRLAAIADLPHHSRNWLWLSDMVLWADLASAVGSAAQVDDGLAALAPFRALFAVAGTAIGASGPVAYPIARLERAAGDTDAALSSARTGLDLARRMGARPWIERGERLLAELAGPA